MSLPPDLQSAYEVFTLLAIRHGYAYAGLMMGLDPPSITIIGNVKERGHALATLLREYANIVDDKTDKGQVAPDIPAKVN